MLLIGVTCLLIVIPTVAHAQTTDLSTSNKASVVLDGQVLFQVGNFGVFSAQERAEQINQTLIDTLKNSQEIAIDLVIVDRQITLQNTTNKKHLLTVTQADVISAANPYNQALLWKNKIQKHLDQGRKERTATYQSQALGMAFLVALTAIAINLAIQLLRSLSARRILKISKKHTQLNSWRRSIIQWVQFILLAFQLGIWIYAFIYITDLFPQTRSWRYWLNSPLVNFNNKSYSALELLLLFCRFFYYFVR